MSGANLGAPTRERVRFFTLISRAEQGGHARLLVESLRAFGGALSGSPVWVFLANGGHEPRMEADRSGVEMVPLAREDEIRSYWFADKVRACAQAEEMATGHAQSLVWLSPESLIVSPPVLFDLQPALVAAFRTVHHMNIGSPSAEPLDAFWRHVYDSVGLSDGPATVTSYVDGQKIRPYYNSHCFVVDPSLGLMRVWRERFQALASDSGFQSSACSDELHRIFLHQAVLSALVTKSLDPKRVRMLPPEYSYPLHFHESVPPHLRPRLLNSLVCAVYEELLPLDKIEIHEPLRSWLMSQMAPNATM